MRVIQAGEEQRPRCPFCGCELTDVLAKKIDNHFFRVSDKYIYFCPECNKVLGIGSFSYSYT